MENQTFTDGCSRCFLKLSGNFTMSFAQTTSENSTKVCAAQAARLFFVIYAIRAAFSGIVFAVSVVLGLTSFINYRKRFLGAGDYIRTDMRNCYLCLV